MARHVISYFFLVVVTKNDLCLTLINQIVYKQSRKHHVFAHIGIVKMQKMRIFVTYRKTACRRSGKHLVAMIHSLPYGTQVITAVAFSLIDTAVGDLGHTTPPPLVMEMATKIPVTIVPMSMAPRLANAASCPPTREIIP